MNVLVICDDFWHPAEVIELGIAPLEKMGFTFTVVKTALDILTPEFIAPYPVIMCCKGNSVNSYNHQREWFLDIAEVGPAEFEEYVRNGGGFLAVHSGNTGKSGQDYANFVGNYFGGHPPRCEVEVKITKEHPITKNVSDFSVRDEHYKIEVTDPEADVFCKTYSESGGEQIGGYVRTIGKGKVCVLTPGHILGVWHNPEFQKLLCNALHFASKKND